MNVQDLNEQSNISSTLKIETESIKEILNININSRNRW